jgi:cell division protease FtsH
VAGRAAEQLVFDEISTGASNDLERATDIAHRMVCEYGMSKVLGTLTYGKKDTEVFLGRDLLKEKNYSEETAQTIDVEVRKIVTAAFERAQLLLKKNQGKLEKLAHTLLEKEVILSEEIDQILHLKTPAVKTPKA